MIMKSQSRIEHEEHRSSLFCQVPRLHGRNSVHRASNSVSECEVTFAGVYAGLMTLIRRAEWGRAGDRNTLQCGRPSQSSYAGLSDRKLAQTTR